MVQRLHGQRFIGRGVTPGLAVLYTRRGLQVLDHALQTAVSRVRDVSIDELGDPRMGDPGGDGDFCPPAATRKQEVTDFLVEWFFHARKIAKLCYSNKQHFASNKLHTPPMSRPSLNEILAANLARLMEQRGWKQAALAKQSGVGQTTISLYLSPERRQPSKSGKLPSAKLSEVESLAVAVGVEPWELLKPVSVTHKTPAATAKSGLAEIDSVENPFPSLPSARAPWDQDWQPTPAKEVLRRVAERGEVVTNVSAGSPPPANDKFEKIPELGEVRLAAGEGIENDQELITGHVQFRQSFLRSIGADGGRGRLVYAKGDSMAPKIQDGWALIVVPANLSVHDLVPNTVYAINYDGRMLVKIVTRDKLSDMWIARSANNKYADIPLGGDATVRILGRVAWAGGLLRSGDASQWEKC
jgi:phage repressor protein C with HTH and peptisase S24 domain/transcriptional regulator with XRE-family HTH domain